MPSTHVPAPRDFERPTWRTLVSPPADGVANMALDDALMARAARTREWVLRAYGWSTPTLSLGRNQRARDAFDRSRLADAGVAVVRRPTGGRAIFHSAEVTYSVTGPVGDSGIGVVYGRINRLLLDALARLGVVARIAAPVTGGPAVPPGLAPCFDHPAKGEIVTDAGKLVGSAQWRDAGALLQHGSILLAGDQSAATAFLTVPAPPPPVPATLGALLGRQPDPDEVVLALHAALANAMGGTPDPLEYEPALAADVHERAARYADDAWTWRR